MPEPPSLHNRIAVLSALSAIEPQSKEKVVQMLWQVIINEWFPPREGYKYPIKTPVLTNDRPDFVVLQIRAVILDPTRENQFIEHLILQIECKRPSFDTPSDWENTTDHQFLEYLEASGGDSNKMYGAVAIGKKVQFHRYDGTQGTTVQKLVPLHNEPIDFDQDGSYEQVEAMLNMIKATAWQWATYWDPIALNCLSLGVTYYIYATGLILSYLRMRKP